VVAELQVEGTPPPAAPKTLEGLSGWEGAETRAEGGVAPWPAPSEAITPAETRRS
jgi:hypothetical protein